MKVARSQNDQDKVLVGMAFAYACVALVGAAIAIAGNLSAEFMGHIPTTTVVEDFLLPWGWGTGISPPLILILLILTVAGLLIKSVGPLAVWRWLLTIGGALFAVGQLGEPHAYQILTAGDDFTLLHAIIIVAMIVTPLVMTLVGLRAIWAARTTFVVAGMTGTKLVARFGIQRPWSLACPL